MSTKDVDFVIRMLKHQNLECTISDAQGKITSVVNVGNALPKPTKKIMMRRSTLLSNARIARLRHLSTNIRITMRLAKVSRNHVNSVTK